jgi:outer membrane protein TolC
VVQIAVQKNPILAAQKEQLGVFKGLQQESSGDFDFLTYSSLEASRNYVGLTDEQQQSLTRSSVDVTSSSISLGLSKQLRTSQTLKLDASVERTQDDVDNPTSPNTGSVTITAIQPLLRGRGSVSASAKERAAYLLLEASEKDLRQTLAETISTTVSAYWQYVSANERLNILRESESRTEKRYRDVKALIAADEQPKSDLSQSKADLASIRAARINAETNVFTARQNLGIAIGLPYRDIYALPKPATKYPALKDFDLPNTTIVPRVISQIWNNRSELLAAKVRTKASETLVEAAKRDLLPDLSLQLQAGYSAFDEGSAFDKYFSAFERDIPGANVSAKLVYEFPIGNNTRKGRLYRLESLLRQNKINEDELKRSIESEVAVALSILKGSSDSYIEAVQASSQYEQALDSERQKYRLQTSTLLDLQQLEDKYTQALLNQIDAATAFAIAVIQLRRVSGSIVPPDNTEIELNYQNLTGIPQILSKQTTEKQS